MTFTGIVEEMGDVVSMVEVGDLVLWDGSTGKGHNLTIKCTKCVEDAELGCSIAVNGTCLTVTEFDTATGIFTVGVAPETYVGGGVWRQRGVLRCEGGCSGVVTAVVGDVSRA